MTTVVISQPMLFPWSGFFELVACADVFVHLDDVQFSKGGFTNRVQIKHENGIKWMTIPVKGAGLFPKIGQLDAAGIDWKRQHRELVRQSLAGARNLPKALELFDRVYAERSLVDLLTSSVEASSLFLGLRGPKLWLKSSDMQMPGASWQRVLAIVKALGGNRYVTAHGASNYLNHQEFERQGVCVEYIQYSKTEYPQLNGPFVPHVSIIDPVANLGRRVNEIIRPNTVGWREFITAKQSSSV